MASSDESCEKECPLCMEPLELDDLNFYPCSCHYQICRFCWHRIRTDENGLCPACRQQYPEDPVNFKPLSAEEVQKIKTEKKQKQQKERQKVSECRKHLANLRVMQKNLVYVVGLSPRLADPETLKKPEYFGRFGKIHKVVVVTPNTNNCTSQTPVNNGTAYVTYVRTEDALKAITNVNNVQVDGRALKACLGTTKYCSAFLRNQSCHKQLLGECMYLHEVAEDEASFTKEDMHHNKHADYERRLIERFTVGNANSSMINNEVSETTEESSAWQKGRTQMRSKSYSTSVPHKSRSEERLEEVGGSLNLGSASHLSHSASLVQTQSDTNCGGQHSPHMAQDDLFTAMALHNNSPSRCESTGGLNNNNSATNPDSDWPTRLFANMHNTNSQSLFSQADVSVGVSEMSPESGLGGGDAGCSSSTDSPGAINSSEPSLASMLAAHVTASINGNVNNTHSPHRGNITSEDPAVVAGGAPLTTVTHAPTTDWQAAFGLLPKTHTYNQPTLLPHHNDDDLGFDPFSESVKGLADLLEQEKEEQKAQMLQKQRLKLMNANSRALWPPRNGTPSGSLPLDSGLMRQSATSPIPHNFNTPPPGFIPHHQDSHQNGPKLSGLNGYPPMNGMRLGHGQGMYPPLAPPRDPSPGPRSISPAPPTDSFSLKELQALLPNVNVRFAPGSQSNNPQHNKTSPSPNWLSCPPPPLGHPPPFNQPPPPLSVSTNLAMNSHSPMRPSPPGPPDALFSMPPPPFGAPPRPPMPPGYALGAGWPSITPPPPPGFSPRQQSI